MLESVAQGDPKAAGDLLPLVYEELRRVAAARMANSTAGQTLQPTAVVHEAWLRLVGQDNEAQFQGRTHFLAAAAEAMRHILIDRARRKQTLGYGGMCGTGQPGWDLNREVTMLSDPDGYSAFARRR